MSDRLWRGKPYLALIVLAGGCAIYDASQLGGSSRVGNAGGSTDAESGRGGASSTAGFAGLGGHPTPGGASPNGAMAGATDIAGAAGVAGADGTPDAGDGGGDQGGAATGGSGTAGSGGVSGTGGTAACVRETIAEYCSRLGKNCESDGVDNCGNALKGADCGSCSKLKICGGTGTPGVCGTLTDPALGGIAQASNVFNAAENETKAFDLDTSTKWFSGPSQKTGWLAYQFSGTSTHVVHSYSVTSANDVPERDPKDWELQGSSDGSTWVTVDERSGQAFANRFQTNSYTCSNTTAYPRYRLFITANNSGNELQVAELALYGD